MSDQVTELRDLIKELEGDYQLMKLSRDAKLCSQCPRTGELDALRAEVARLRATLAGAPLLPFRVAPAA